MADENFGMSNKLEKDDPDLLSHRIPKIPNVIASVCGWAHCRLEKAGQNDVDQFLQWVNWR